MGLGNGLNTKNQEFKTINKKQTNRVKNISNLVSIIVIISFVLIKTNLSINNNILIHYTLNVNVSNFSNFFIISCIWLFDLFGYGVLVYLEIFRQQLKMSICQLKQRIL